MSELVLLNKRQKISLFPSRRTEDNSNFIFNHFNDLNDFNQFMSSSVDIPSGRDEEATDTFLIAEQKETKESKKTRPSAKTGKSHNLSFSISLFCCYFLEKNVQVRVKGEQLLELAPFSKIH